MSEETSWRTAAFRQSVVSKMYVWKNRTMHKIKVDNFFRDEAIRQSGMNTSRNSIEMENHVYQKAKNKDEYLGFVARLILHVREMSKCVPFEIPQADCFYLNRQFNYRTLTENDADKVVKNRRKKFPLNIFVFSCLKLLLAIHHRNYLKKS